MHPIRENLIKIGNLIADIAADGRVGKTAKKRAKRFKADAEARNLQAARAESQVCLDHSLPSSNRKQCR